MKKQAAVDYYCDRALEEQAHIEATLEELRGKPERSLIEEVYERLYFDHAAPMAGHLLVANLMRRQSDPKLLLTTALPMVRVESDAPVFSLDYRGTNVGSCGEAEYKFCSALEQIRGLRVSGADFHDRISVYYDPETQVPLLLRKQKDESSAITLQPITVGQAYLPPGTYVGIVSRHQNDGPLVAQTNQDKAMIQAYELQTDLMVDPLRLSPWAYSTSQDQALFAVNAEYDAYSGELNYVNYNAARGRMITDVSLGDFQEAATEVMKMCGVAA